MFLVLAFFLLTFSTNLLASSKAGVDFIDYYHIFLHLIGFHAQDIEKWVPVIGTLFITGLILFIGIQYKSKINKSIHNDQIYPDGKMSIISIFDSILDFIYDLSESMIGHHFKNYFPLLSSIFIFILLCNLSGLVPGFHPATISIDTNLAIGLVVFFMYNYAGFKEHGVSYLKQLLGPVAFIAPLFLVIELVSHMARPFSLALRLMANIYGDHLILSIFTWLTYLVIPGFLMFFGLLVAVVQSFVFTLLTGIYISMATSHDH